MGTKHINLHPAANSISSITLSKPGDIFFVVTVTNSSNEQHRKETPHISTSHRQHRLNDTGSGNLKQSVADPLK